MKLPKIDLNKAKAELCKRKLSYFVQEFWDEVVPNPLVWNFHMDAVCDEVQAIFERVFLRQKKLHDLLINIPPGMSKTMIASVMANAWAFARKSSIRIACGSYSDMAITSMADNLRVVMRSEKYRLFFPDVEIRKDRNNLHNFKTKSNGEFYAFTIGGTITSKHFDVLQADDPIDPRRSASKAELLSTNEFMQKTLPSRCTDKEMTPLIVTMQRLHEEDPSGRMLESGLPLRHICLPAEVDTNVRPVELALKYTDGLLDPNRLSRETLNTQKIKLGSYAYAGQMQQKPAPQEGGLFKKNWFKIIDANSVPKSPVYFVTDTAYTDNEKNDPTGIMAYIMHGADLYITKFEKGHWEFLEQCKNIVRFTKDNGYGLQSLVEAEPKASGISIVQTLKAQTGLNIKEAKNPTKDKVARANDIIPYCESGRVYLVRGGWNDEFIEQLATFPNAKHDEEVDCLIMACHRAFKKSKLIRT